MTKTILICIAILTLWVSSGLFDVSHDSYHTAYAQPVENVAAVPSYCVGHENICDALSRSGFNPDQVHLMVAIGQAESHLRIDALGDLTLQNDKWGPSLGYWQIRTLKNPGSNRCRDRGYLEQNLSHQADCAYEISAQGRVYSPWTTWLSGAYKQYM